MDTIENTEIEKRKGPKGRRWFISFGMVVLLVLLFFVLPFYLAPAIQEISFRDTGKSRIDTTLLNDKTVQKKLSGLKKEVAVLDKRLDGFLPHLPYIIINTTRNRFNLFDRNGSLVREGFCSSGSYKQLVSENKTWTFKTPKGRLPVLSKSKNPVWSKPDWAFIEEGLPVPKAGDPSRYESGVLGAYALRMPDAYMLHGTLYKRFLGMPVTHGCVRLGDDDLEAVFHTLEVGSFVYIY